MREGEMYAPLRATAGELHFAVKQGLLTEEEARQVYWSQFPTLREQGFNNAPRIEGR